MDNKIKPYPLTEEALTELESTFSPERFSTYLQETGGNREKAIHLYVWNTSISAAFYGPLQSLEIILRNALHNRLSERYGPNWYENPDMELNVHHRGQIDKAKARLRQGNHTIPNVITAPRIIANLSFGFWVFLLQRRYNQRLWRPTLRKAFPHVERITSQEVYDFLEDLHELRNRIAHHEPIFSEARHRLRERHRNILKIIGWISPHQKDWVAAHSRVEEILNLPQDSATLRF